MVAVEKENGTEVINRNYPPKLAWFFVTVDKAPRTSPCFAGKGRNQSDAKEDDSKY